MLNKVNNLIGASLIVSTINHKIGIIEYALQNYYYKLSSLIYVLLLIVPSSLISLYVFSGFPAP